MSGTDSTAPQPKDGDATGNTGGNAGDDKKFTQAELDAIVKDRLDRAARKADEDRKKADADAEAARLAEQNQFKELADQRLERITELETEVGKVESLTADLDRANAALTKFADEQRKDLPAHIVTLLDKMDLVEQLEYLATNRAALIPKSNVHGGPPPTPRSNGGALSREELKNQYLEQAGVKPR